MSRWFRVDDGLVDDPKVQQLPDRLFRIVINLWCITSQNGGKLPSVDNIAFKLRLTLHNTEKVLDALRKLRLIDDDEDGTRPHNWNGRQFKSDVSTDRVKEFRERQRNVSVTVSETPPDTDTEQNRTDSEKKDIRAVAVATRPDDFEEFWKAYPKRDGANPKAPARKKFFAAVKSGIDARAIIAAAKRSADEARSKGQVGTPYVPQAITWLNQQRWGDYGPVEPVSAPITPQPPSPEMPSDEELRRKYEVKNGQTYAGADEHSHPCAGSGQLAGDTGKLLAEGSRDDRGNAADPAANDHARVPGIRSLGEVLRKTPGLGALGAQGSEDRQHPGDDGPGAVA